ncbi:MAG: hypothetical protein H7A40_04615 [Chlamydiales bacterium]|nr:hypothetical protein [Chlamydiales bacterium]
MKKFVWVLGFFCLPLFCNSVTLFNDSAFKLQATVLSATGENQGTFTILPQHQLTWQDSYSGGQSFSQTPYTVIWYCENGKEFGIVTNVGAGAFVSANSSDGYRICPIPKQNTTPGQPQESN